LFDYYKKIARNHQSLCYWKYSGKTVGLTLVIKKYSF